MGRLFRKGEFFTLTRSFCKQNVFQFFWIVINLSIDFRVATYLKKWVPSKSFSRIVSKVFLMDFADRF